MWDGWWFITPKRTFNWVTSYVGTDANDKASSLTVAYTNPASPYVYFYRDANYGPPYVIFKEGGGSNDLRNQMMTSDRNWDDEISSIKG